MRIGDGGPRAPEPKLSRALIVGAGGLLGRALVDSCPGEIEPHPRSRADLDVTDRQAVERALAAIEPGVVINAAAYTAVDRAESEPEVARRVNEEGAAHLARAAAAAGARLVQISTDFVFDGRQGRPYAADDATRPQSVYGVTKRAGELAALELGGDSALVLRTAWLYGAGHANFVTGMLRRLAGGQPVAAVVDQVGAPTWVRSLAAAVWRAVAKPSVTGVHHWTDAGVASRYDLTVAIQEEALAAGLLDDAVPIEPVPATRFPAPARRPAFSVLELGPTCAALGVAATHWRQSLRQMLAELVRA